jgi:hypothetical protein
MSTVVESTALPMTQDGVLRRRRAPNLAYLDMSTRWTVNKSKTGSVVVGMKYTLDSADDAMAFVPKAFAYHGYRLSSGSVKPDTKKEFEIYVEMHFTPEGVR